mmetsp:Transcript_3074/g.8923  ORF Transcript_3074/g.8923 Transcript_3074/m.8923 type:complete len:97 (-) Transcript_3074:33-323(-)
MQIAQHSGVTLPVRPNLAVASLVLVCEATICGPLPTKHPPQRRSLKYFWSKQRDIESDGRMRVVAWSAKPTCPVDGKIWHEIDSAPASVSYYRDAT